MKYFNTALALSMLPDGDFTVRTVDVTEAARFLREEVANVANPTHANTLDAISRKLGIDVQTSAKGGRVSLAAGDECLVAQISGIPRETREFTNEEIQAARFEFRIVTVR